MSSSSSDDILIWIREITTRLRSPISDVSELLSLLSGPLDIIGLLPPAFRRFCTNRLGDPARDSFNVLRHISSLQSIILESVVPTWESTLRERGYDSILFQYFCPDAFSSNLCVAGDVSLCAYSSLLASHLVQFSVDVLQRLTRHYPIDRLHSIIYSRKSSIPDHKKTVVWEDTVQNIVSVPLKIANSSNTLDTPPVLHPHEYYCALCTRCEILVSSFAQKPDFDVVASLSFLVTKMIYIGLFPSTISLAPSETSFPSVAFSIIRTRTASLSDSSRENYIGLWREIFASLPSSLMSKALSSLFAHLAEPPDNLDTSEESRGLIKREAVFLERLLGALEGEEDEKWISISSALLIRTWSMAKARTLVCWASISDKKAVPPRAVQTLIGQVMQVWSSEEHIKHSLLSQHQYLTTLLVLAVYALPISHQALQSLAFSDAFIAAIGRYLSHLDPAVRRCGMLAAELVAQRTNKRLDFKQWEGEGQGQDWARAVRHLVMTCDADAEEVAADVLKLEPTVPNEPEAGNATEESTKEDVPRVQLAEAAYDSDDDLEGYASLPSSSRPSTPTNEELEELEKDPTLNVGKKKIQRPVHLFDLAQLISSSRKPDDPQNAERIQMALDSAEELIRKKKGFGLELEENAVNLVYLFVGLQNNYESEGFAKKRQAVVHSLVACCPRKAAPTIIDEFFKNQYSTEQRFAMLNALALGARELASLSIPPSTVSPERAAFPSKQLPPALHRKYIAYDEANYSQIQQLLEDISRSAIESGKEAAEAEVAPIVRERQLRIRQPARVAEVKPGVMYVPKESTFAELAAEYFIGPLVGKFWLFLRDEQEREARTARRTTAYSGAGTGLILSPMVLAHFLGTVAVLMHAARHSPAFLAVLAPDALELAVTLGTRPMAGAEEDKEREAAILTAALELAVIILDGCLELDGGRSLCLEYTALVLGTGEWAGEVMNALERGVRVPGGGGTHEIKLRQAAAGVVLKVDELASRWRQSMVSLF